MSMSQPLDTLRAPTSEAEPAPDLVGAGDLAARAGRWSEAIEAWATAVSATDDTRAANRLRWFLQQTAVSGSNTYTPSRLRPNPVIVGTMAACLGTACVLVAQGLPSGWRDVLAVLAWVLYVVAAVSGLWYAFIQRRNQSPDEMVTSAAVERALTVARTLDTGSDTIAAGPWRQS